MSGRIQKLILISDLFMYERFRSEKVSVGVHLLQFSSFSPHPLARVSYVHLMDLRADSIGVGEPSATVLVSGKHLVLLLRLPVWPGSHLQSNTLFVIDWLTGAILVVRDFLRIESFDSQF